MVDLNLAAVPIMTSNLSVNSIDLDLGCIMTDSNEEQAATGNEQDDFEFSVSNSDTEPQSRSIYKK